MKRLTRKSWRRAFTKASQRTNGPRRCGRRPRLGKPLLVAVLAVLVFSACQTRPATEVSYDAATLNGRGECSGTYTAEFWWEYGTVGFGEWNQTPPRTLNCPGSTPTVDLDAQRVTGLSDGVEYRFRLCGRANNGPIDCYDQNGTKGGTSYHRFTTLTHPTVVPRSANAFDDSIGVGTHPSYTDTPGHAAGPGGEARTAGLMDDAGIRHVRNEVVTNVDPTFSAQVAANAEAWPLRGIKSLWGVGRCSVAIFEGNLRARLDKIAQIDHDLSTGLESTNEPDLDIPSNQCFEDWPNRERLWAAHISQTKDAHPDAVIRGLPVLGPSFVGASSASTIGDLTQWIDFGNTHPYSGCTSPTPQHVQQNGINNYAAAAPGKPVMATEVGFHTAVNTSEPGAQPPCDERTGGIYTLRTVLEHFKVGVARSYLYEAIDLFPNPARDRSEENFGLLRADFSAKPAYSYLKNLLAVTASSSGETLTALKMNVEQQPADLRSLLLRKANGDYILALWRHASVWDRDQRIPKSVAAEPVRISLPSANSVSRVLPNSGTSGTPLTISDRRVTLDVGGDAVLLVVR